MGSRSITSDGKDRQTREIGSTASEYWRLLRIKAPSRPLPLSNAPFTPGQTLIILGKSAHSGAIESHIGTVGHDEDPFFLSTETPNGFNGSPIFDEGGKVAGVQIFRPETGKPGTLMCLKVPTKKLIEGMASQVARAKPPSSNPSEKPISLSGMFYEPQSPVIVVSNSSDNVAEGVAWAMSAIRTSDLSYFGFATQTIGFIKPHSQSGRYLLDLPNIPKTSDGDGQVKEGDELTGSVSIDCPHCEIQTYIVHFVWRQTGWFFEYAQKAGYVLPKDMSKDGRVRYVQFFTGDTFAKDRIEIKPTLPR